MFVNILRTVAKTVTGLMVMAVSVSPQLAPEYLYPISAYRGYDPEWFDHSRMATFEVLIGDPSPELWMIAHPGSESAYALILRETNHRDTIRRRYELEHAMPKTPIIVRDEVLEAEWKCEVDENVEVTRNTTYFPKDVAEEVIRVWRAVVKETRYDIKVEGMDGALYHFCAGGWDDFYGSCYSPRSGKPRMLVDLGHLLIDWASPKLVHGETLDEIRDLVQEISDKLE